MGENVNTIQKLDSLAWGPDLPDGRHVLYVISDNDLVPANPTQIYAFAIDEAELTSPLRVASAGPGFREKNGRQSNIDGHPQEDDSAVTRGPRRPQMTQRKSRKPERLWLQGQAYRCIICARRSRGRLRGSPRAARPIRQDMGNSRQQRDVEATMLLRSRCPFGAALS